MSNKIQSIEEIKDYKPESEYWGYDGYAIKTEGDSIYILISNMQSCCESWGYLASDDKFEQYIDAELLKLEVVSEDKAIIDVGDMYEGGAIFVNVETSLGLLQFAVYNAHNGYYGHTVRIISKELNLEDGV